MAKKKNKKLTKTGQLQATCSLEVIKQLDFYAGKLGVSRSKFTSIIIESAMTDEKWIYDITTSAFMQKISRAIIGVDKNGNETRKLTKPV